MVLYMNNKTFEDWLVVSDVDGTLNNKRRRLPRKNYDAIKKFTERGGNFTLASGRTAFSISKSYKTVPANQPVVFLNGAGIYDVNAGKLLWSNPIGAGGRQFVRDVMAKFGSVEVGIFCADVAYIVRGGLFSKVMMIFDKSPREYADIDEIPQDGWLKVIFYAMPGTLKRLKAYSDEYDGHGAHFMFSSIVTFELLEGGTHKGTGVMRLAEELGIDKSHVAAIGDYYNDFDMLKTVGLPACAGQAPKPMKDICEFVACHCNDGCVADLLDYITNKKCT